MVVHACVCGVRSQRCYGLRISEQCGAGIFLTWEEVRYKGGGTRDSRGDEKQRLTRGEKKSPTIEIQTNGGGLAGRAMS